jgi:hypothetical protein
MANKFRGDTGTTDSDGDGLSDDFERNVLGTRPDRRDSDGDGLNDRRELDFGANPLDDDSDDDGLKDLREVILGTDPSEAVSTGAGVGDLEAVRAGTAIPIDLDRDREADWVEAARSRNSLDTDTLSDAEERWLRTDQRGVDTDGDGIADDLEALKFGTDPRVGTPPPVDPGKPDMLPNWDPDHQRPVPPTPQVPGGPDAMLDDPGHGTDVVGVAVDDVEGPMPTTDWDDPSATANYDE